jgi:drug/metabolite transporter (DMT)-like permease
MKQHRSTAILVAIGAAAFFGGSTPFAKQLLGHISPILLAGLLYLGSGVGLSLVRLITQKGYRIPKLTMTEWVWFLSSILFGGILGPVLLMLGLLQTSAASASLLLNLEAVLTAVLAWVIFKENTDRWIILGMILIVVGGILLAWPQHGLNSHSVQGPLLIAGACLCWAIDNNFTSKVSASDAMFIASSKGLTAGIINTGLALLIGSHLPSWNNIGYAMLIGFIGYGVSLVFFVLALRGLGSARTGALLFPHKSGHQFVKL